MNRTLELLWLSACFALRCGVPLALTLLLAQLLRKLDARWAAEAQGATQQKTATKRPQTPCWEIRDCAPQMRESCPAYHRRDVPCWQVFGRNGSVRNACRNCEVYQRAWVAA